MTIMMVCNVLPALATSNNPDYGYGCGADYWGAKPHNNNYGGTYLFGRNTNCTVLHGGGIPGTGDTRTNYFEAEVIDHLQSNTDSVSETSIEGCDPFGVCDSNSGAAHSTTFGSSVLGSDTNLALITPQFVWLSNSTNKPVDSKAQANVLTDLWWVPKDGSTSYAIVIDYAEANLISSGGGSPTWKIGATSGNYSDYFVNKVGSICVYHFNKVIDSNSAANTWRQASTYSSISSDMTTATASTTTYAKFTSNTCSTTIPSTEQGNSKWQLDDVESGTEVYTTNSTPTTNTGTITVGFSNTELQY
ncbi:MAG: hypothetical protein ACREBI_11440 [Nitrosotalea sp.]